MTQQQKTTGKAAANKAAAARVEKAPVEKTCVWRGITFSLPDTLSATFAFDMAELEAGAGLGAMFRLLSGLVGSDQLASIREKVGQDGDSLDDLDEILTDLLGQVFGAYGVSLGESEASPSS